MPEQAAVLPWHIKKAGCPRRLTISPPPAIGGLIMRNVNPLDAMFDPPYGVNLVPDVLDMIDETIRIMLTPDFMAQVQETEISSAHVEDEFQPGYTFI